MLSSDELIAERNFDLYGWFMKAYHEEGEVQPFKIMQAKKAAMAEEAGEDPDGGGLGGEKEGEKILGEKDRLPLLGQTDYATAAVDVIDGDLEDFAGESGSVAVAAPEGEEDALLGGDEEVDSSEEEDEEEDDDEAAKREQALEAKNSFLSLLGMGRLADDAMWMNMTTYDMKRKKMKNKGRLAFSISILPMEDVESRPAGHGQRPQRQPLPAAAARPRASTPSPCSSCSSHRKFSAASAAASASSFYWPSCSTAARTTSHMSPSWITFGDDDDEEEDGRGCCL